MVIAFPAVIIFGAVSWLLLRSRTIRPLEATIVGLFGFFLATTGLGHGLAVILDDMLGAWHGTPASPVQPGPAAPTAPSPAGPTGPGVVPWASSKGVIGA